MTKDILVFGEWREGHLHPASLQCLTAAKQIGGGAVPAAIIGKSAQDAASTLAAHGAASVFVVDGDAFARYSPLTYARALAVIIAKADPQIVLLPASFMGRDLGPRVAARMNAGLATDCTEL